MIGAKSKRMPTKLRKNIQKKIREHGRRVKKEARKMAALGIHRGKKKEKELHVPNLYPYKKKLIEHLQNSKKTAQNKRMLEKLAKKNQLTSNMEVFKEDIDVRVDNYMDAMENKKSKL